MNVKKLVNFINILLFSADNFIGDNANLKRKAALSMQDPIVFPGVTCLLESRLQQTSILWYRI